MGCIRGLWTMGRAHPLPPGFVKCRLATPVVKWAKRRLAGVLANQVLPKQPSKAVGSVDSAVAELGEVVSPLGANCPVALFSFSLGRREPSNADSWGGGPAPPRWKGGKQPPKWHAPVSRALEQRGNPQRGNGEVEAIACGDGGLARCNDLASEGHGERGVLKLMRRVVPVASDYPVCTLLEEGQKAGEDLRVRAPREADARPQVKVDQEEGVPHSG